MSNNNVQVIDRGLDILEQLATAENGMSIAELTEITQLPKSTIHRILSTYADRHYVEKNEETNVYCLGYKNVEIASLYLNKIILKTEAAPIMRELATTLGCTSYLGVLEQNEVMYLEKAEQFNSLRLYTHIGKREPVYCTALGKVLASSLPEDELRVLLRHLSFIPYTPNTINNSSDFEKEVDFVHQNGYAVDHEEHTLGSSCVAIPIYDYTRNIMAAMSVSGPGLLTRFDEAFVYERLHEASIELSKRVGYTVPHNV